MFEGQTGHRCSQVFLNLKLNLPNYFLQNRTKRNGKTDRNLWNKNNVHGCFSIFSSICLIIFYGMEWNGKNRHLCNINNDYGCFSIFSLICLIIFYCMEWNGMEKPTHIFGIKTMFTGVSQSLA
jgi:hypothetical protein